jgi:trk/ktr system potassium uptake protein
MDIVIMGAGRVGLNLASYLISDDLDITIIENDVVICSNTAKEFDASVICGNGTDIETLKEANIQDTDVFVAATGNDASNLLACVLVRDYKIPKIIARISDPNHKDAFKKLGIDFVINPELTAAQQLERMITRPNIADLAIIGKGDAELLDFTLQSGEMIGKKIRDISPNPNFIIVALYENGDIVIPKSYTVLVEGMKISILVKTKYAKEVFKRFEITSSETGRF